MHCTFLRLVSAEQMLWCTAIMLSFLVGALGGSIAMLRARIHADVPMTVADTPSDKASVVLEGFRDGALRGRAAGTVRLFAQEEAVAIDARGSFAIVHPAFRIEEVTVPVPPGMRFVASKRGSKYYAVDSAGGSNIVPENRVYFPDAASAEAAGFHK